jgi:hypothetical protein
MKPSKHMSDKNGNLVVIPRLLVTAGQIALAVVVAQLASVFLGGPGEFAEITGDGNVAIRPETRDYLTWEVYHAQGMPCVLEVRKSSRLGTGVILLG